MTNATHTPGPWETKVVNNSQVRGAVHIFAAGRPGTLICEGAYGRTLDESDANARLISAAPDLLAELERIAQRAEMAAATFPNAPGCGDFAAIARDARAMAAKARGNGEG